MKKASEIAICILGSQNDGNGNLSEEGKSRVQTALSLSKITSSDTFILTGAFGQHFNTTKWPHWSYMQKYLSKIADSTNLNITTVNSGNTIEDFEMLSECSIVNRIDCMFIVTSTYHIPRVSLIANRYVKVRQCVFPAIDKAPFEFGARELMEIEKIMQLLGKELCN
jgi:hypothetical protein